MTAVPATQTTHAHRIAPLESWHFWFVGRDQLVRNLLARYGCGSPLLDVGCGTANFVHNLGADGADGFAMDVTTPTGHPGRSIVGDGTRMPISSGSVATVLARDVLEHVDDGPLLSECHRVLRPGGMLIALVPAWPSLWSSRDEQAGHLRRYTRSTLRRVVAANGFEVAELRGYQFLLLPVAAASRAGERWRSGSVAETENNPSRWANRALSGINRAEAGLARSSRLRPPTGTSLAIVAVRG